MPTARARSGDPDIDALQGGPPVIAIPAVLTPADFGSESPRERQSAQRRSRRVRLRPGCAVGRFREGQPGQPQASRSAGGPGFRHGSVLDTFLPGVLALLAFSTGSGAGWIVIAELQTRTTERLLATPVRRTALLSATILRDIVNFLALAVIAVAIPLDYHPHATGTAALLLLLSLVVATTSAWSTALGLTLRDIGALATVVTGLQLPSCCCPASCYRQPRTHVASRHRAHRPP